MLKLAIIGSAGVPARYGGFETLADQLGSRLGNLFRTHIYCSRKQYRRDERTRFYNQVRLHYLPFSANGIQSIFYDIFSINHALLYADVLLVLGISGGLIFPFLRWFTRKKIIVHVDGMEWKRGKWKFPARKMLKISESIAVKYAHDVITDNIAIRDYILTEYNRTGHLIRYGADHVISLPPDREAEKKFSFLRSGNPDSPGYTFTVCRIEPENNIHMILEAYRKVQTRTIVVAGNWESSPYGRKLRERFLKYENMFLVDPIYDQKRLDMLRSNCAVYIHGHSSGGTNPSLAEAMYLGLPIMAHKNEYNLSTTENQAVYFSNSDELVEIIENTSHEEFSSTGKKMDKIAKQKFIWKDVVASYIALISGTNSDP